ncbi:MAG: hypothetical protein GF317_00480 [Candidatus Lokiarchaeota archaeon]|nr:hypothetical protein [Candidatus Lokiarchaeota archaeon]MBD3198452.1 hypothetical protein [Candidatus Lokiarchaeota archaeon]
MNQVEKQDKLFFYERHFLTLDGLWMIETEKEFGWDFALEIDLAVWNRFLNIMIEEIMKYKKLEQHSIQNLILILAFRWKVEEWDFDVKINDAQSKVLVKIDKCPYNSAMLRNPERHDKIPLICKNMCIPFYEEIISNYNKNIQLDRRNYLGLGNQFCDFTISYGSDKLIEVDTEINLQNTLNVSIKDKLFYLKNGFKLLNNLWIEELRGRTNNNKTMKINQLVWKLLFKILFRRIQRYKGFSTNSLSELFAILKFIWGSEGLRFQTISQEKGNVHFKIIDCPIELQWNKISESDNQSLESLKKAQISIYSEAIKTFNDELEIEFFNFLISNDFCFELKILE